ncbi:hypothetical protein GQ600_19935 [Phytophthora cactorum]|nr:hypothetical protein GQ600_19935 [Phytophthora cactorum]
MSIIVRAPFDHAVKHYPSTSTQLSATSGQVKFPDFESGAVKLLAGSCGVKLAGCSGQSEEEEGGDATTKKISFAEATLYDEAPSPSVVDLKWVPPTSNDVERLFSRAGFVYSRLRRSLNSMTLETILFLQYKRSMWDASRQPSPRLYCRGAFPAYVDCSCVCVEAALLGSFWF